MANLKYDQEIAAPADDDANVSWRLTRAAQLLGDRIPDHLSPIWRIAKSAPDCERIQPGGLQRTAKHPISTRINSRGRDLRNSKGCSLEAAL